MQNAEESYCPKEASRNAGTVTAAGSRAEKDTRSDASRARVKYSASLASESSSFQGPIARTIAMGINHSAGNIISEPRYGRSQSDRAGDRSKRGLHGIRSPAECYKIDPTRQRRYNGEHPASVSSGERSCPGLSDHRRPDIARNRQWHGRSKHSTQPFDRGFDCWIKLRLIFAKERITAALRSVEPSSTTMISSSGHVWRKTDSRVSPTYFSAL